MRGAPSHRRDANHKAIVDELRQCGFSVIDLSQLGHGIPDILVGKYGLFECLVELKSDGEASKAQIEFAKQWRGPRAFIARTAEEIIGHFHQLLQSEG